MNKKFTRPVFAVELYDPAEWDFGPVTFQNIVMVRCAYEIYLHIRNLYTFIPSRWLSLTSKQTATGQSTSWCNDNPEDYSNAVNYTVTGARAITNSTGVTCSIDSIVLHNPQNGTTTSPTSPTIPTAAPKNVGAAKIAPSTCTVIGSSSVIMLVVGGFLWPWS